MGRLAGIAVPPPRWCRPGRPPTADPVPV